MSGWGTILKVSVWLLATHDDLKMLFLGPVLRWHRVSLVSCPNPLNSMILIKLQQSRSTYRTSKC